MENLIKKITILDSDIIAQFELFSFDIFDTLVTRTTATPVGIFKIIEKNLQNTNLPEFFKSNFFNIRISAEEQARRFKSVTKQTREINIDEIYDFIERNWCLTKEERNFIKELELHTEAQNLIPIENNLEFLKSLVAQNKRVILVSDMYIPNLELRKLLVNVDDVFKDIPLYVSCDYEKSKANGLLYEYIQSLYKIEPSKWFHFGDNKKSDVDKAKTYGIKSKHFPFPGLKPYEKGLDFTSLDIQLSAGCSRYSRLTKVIKNQDKYDFGATFTAPIFYDYINYVINFALKKGSKTLYFVARDGFILKIITDIIIEKRGLDLKTKYIYGSRKAWRIITEENYEEFVKCNLPEFSYKRNLKHFAYKFHVEAEEFAQRLKIKNPDLELNDTDIQKLEEKLLKDLSIKNWLIEQNKRKKELAIKYLTQEVNTVENSLIFVDLSGSGITHKNIKNLLQISGYNGEVFTLFFVAFPRIKEALTVYCFNNKFNNYILEYLSKSYDGQTIGYYSKNNKIEPIFDNNINSAMEKWGLDAYIEGIKNYTLNRLYIELEKKHSFTSFNIYTKYIQFVNNSLDRETANILGEIPQGLIGLEDNNSKAQKFKKTTLIKDWIGIEKNKKVAYGPSKISYARSSESTQKIYQYIKQHPNFKEWAFSITYKKAKKEFYITLLGQTISLRKFLWRK